MREDPLPRSSGFNGRILLACVLCVLSVFLGTFSFAGSRLNKDKRADSKRPDVGESPTAQMTGWSVVDSPSTTIQTLPGVACTSAADCWAVGFYYNADSFVQTLIEHWNGASWQIIPSPNPSSTQHNRLQSVSCVSGSDCWAVGYTNFFSAGQHYQTLIEHWNGSAWSIASPPIDKYQLNGVTCNSSADCWAVGIGRPGAINSSIIQHWNGSTWSTVSSPNTGSPRLENITCASASDCWAVGNYFSSSSQTFVEHWDGTLWSVVSSPNTSPSQNNYLLGVKCVSASRCFAVGSYQSAPNINQTLIEQWDGVSWSIVSSPNGSVEYNTLNDVTCTSASDCWAVGFYYLDDIGQRLLEHWNGTSWSIVSSSTSIPESFFDGVACTAASQCWAVGSSYPGEVVIERWNGTAWTRVNAPNAEGGNGLDDSFADLACNSASDCWAVGSILSHWNGTAWSLVRPPLNANMQSNYLDGVTCISASNCWAVGSYLNDPVGYQTLINHWDGNSWSIVNSPNIAGADENYLYEVACTSASDCWAVGTYYDPVASQTLIEHWNGSSWSIVTSPSPNPSGGNYLNSVACISPTQCWAVGSTSDASTTQTLIELWNGTSWSVFSSPNANPNTDNFLTGVTCTSASDCWAVGLYYNDDFVQQTMVVHWNGTEWSIGISPSTSPTVDNRFFGVTCASAADCWAVGSYVAFDVFPPPLSQTFIQHWDGNSWSFAASPNVNFDPTFFNSNELLGVACASGLRCWAAGYYINDADHYHTLLAQYIAPPPTITVVTRPLGDHFIILGGTVPNVTVTIEASTDLISFTVIGTTTSNGTGEFYFEDVNAGSFPRRFYRAYIQ